MEGEQMEEELWRQLPEELQLKILDDHLPVYIQCRLRSVSRAWKTPRLRCGALQGLYVLREKTFQKKGIFLDDRRIGKSHRLLREAAIELMLADCVNGLLGGVMARKKTKPDGTISKRSNMEMRDQVEFMVFNVFCPSWTHLPPPPPAPGRRCIFAGMSRKPRSSDEIPPPRIGITKLEDYIFVVAMGNRCGVKVRSPNMVLQVHHAGEWSSTLLQFPPGHLLMYSEFPQFRCGVLRGSDFFFLTMHSDNTQASLCCVDLLRQEKHCRVLCGVDKAFVTGWCDRRIDHPKLAVCSGKLLLVHTQVLHGSEEETFAVEVLDEEKLRWRFVSSLPQDVKADPTLFPTAITCGGDELVIYSGGAGYMYNLVTGAWSITSDLESLYPISYQ